MPKPAAVLAMFLAAIGFTTPASASEERAVVDGGAARNRAPKGI